MEVFGLLLPLPDVRDLVIVGGEIDVRSEQSGFELIPLDLWDLRSLRLEPKLEE